MTKTITPAAREGNPPVRIAETEAGMLNSIGLANPGPRAVPRRAPAASARARRAALGLGRRFLGAPTTPRPAPRSEDVAAIELNLSCPNVDEAPEGAAAIVAACRAATALPLYAKLSPAAWDIAEVARAVEAAGADGLSLVNTLRGLALDQRTLRPLLARATGGYSGPALKPVALAAVWACAAAVDLPIVGMGGVRSGLDALELIAAGANAVALGTVLFSDPGAATRIRGELAAEAAARGSRMTPGARESPFVPANGRIQF